MVGWNWQMNGMRPARHQLHGSLEEDRALTIGIRKTNAGRNLLAGAIAIGVLAAASITFGQSGGHEYTVVMSNMDYGKIPSDLKVGDTIVWVNRDTVLHSVTARDHSFDLRLNPGQSARLTLQKPGRIAFECLFHTAMRGTLVVADK